MSSSRNKSKSSGLRILWIPGGRKNHSKGRMDSTSKQVSYGMKQKKTEMWSLGGSKAQKDFLKSDPDTSLLDGPSVSGLAPVTCAIGAAGVSAATAAAKCATTTANDSIAPNPPPTTTTTSTTEPSNNTPTTPSSTTSTALVVSLPSSPDPPATDTMPAKTTSPPAVIVTTTTTTAEIIDENRFSILGKDISDEIDIYALPSPPKDDLLLDTSAGTTVSTATTPSPSNSPRSDAKSTKDSADTPTKKKLRNHNNNHQGDVNSIESIADDKKIPNSNLDWIDELYLERNGNEILRKSKNKKKKKLSTAKQLDQLDGVPTKTNASEPSTDEDEKVVKCLYYTLMCCDCSIS